MHKHAGIIIFLLFFFAIIFVLISSNPKLKGYFTEFSCVFVEKNEKADCYHSAALLEESISPCAKIETDNVNGTPLRDICYFRIAEKTKSIASCKEIDQNLYNEFSQSACIYEIALLSKNETFCEEIIDEIYTGKQLINKSNCLMAVHEIQNNY